MNNQSNINNYPSELKGYKGIEQRAEKIYNVEKAENINNIVNYAPERMILPSSEYYNLFIIYNEEYKENTFHLGNGRIFEYTTTAIKNKFSSFTLEDINEIISLPALFLPEYSEHNNDIKIGFIGKLIDIDKTNGYGDSNFRFQKDYEIDIDTVVKYKQDLVIDKWELSRTHWAIKRANLLDIINKLNRDM